MMWLAPSWKLIKDVWPAFAAMALVLLILIATGLFAVSKCSSGPDGPDYSEDARDLVLEQYQIEKDKNDKRLLELEEKMKSLEFQVEVIDDEIAESAKEREEIQDAISNAGSIDAIDRILKSGIPGATGGRRHQ